jgi:hypothetical protein
MFKLSLLLITISFITIQVDTKTEGGFSSEPVSCKFINSTSTLQCQSLTGSVDCRAKSLGLTKECTSFAIGILQANGGDNPMNWFRIFPKQGDKNKWWYYKGFTDTQTRYSIHYKNRDGVHEKGFVVLDYVCWKNMVKIIRGSTKTTRIMAQVKHRGPLSILSGKSKYSVQAIGNLTVVF